MMIKNLFKSVIHFFGLEISRYSKIVNPQYSYVRNEEMINGLLRAKGRGLNPATIIDIGAAEGSWSLSCKEVWPNAEYLLMEPLQERKSALESLSKRFENFRYIGAAAGKEKGQLKFYVAGDLDGSAVADSTDDNENIRLVDITTVDDEVRSTNVSGPYILKLDTHGFEVPIFEGAVETLKNTELVIVEVYGFNLTKDSLLFYQMTDFLDKHGFRMVDMVDIMRRQKDGAFWQADAFYVKKNASMFSDNSYS